MQANLPNLFDLTGKVAVVTGGGGILGRQFCQALASFGASVALVDVNEEAARAAVDAIGQELDSDVTVAPFVCDVSDPASVASLVNEVTAKLGGIDILHNNAASKSEDLDAFFAPFEEYSLDEWRRVMSVNLDGMFLVAQAVGKHMVERGQGGSVVQTASIYGIVAPDPRIYEGSYYLERQINTPAVYSASKAGVVGLTKYLAAHWAPHGIRVNTLTPGGVESGQNDTFKAKYSERIPLGRMAERSELQGALIYLASDASSYVTGQNLVVDGGLTCW